LRCWSFAKKEPAIYVPCFNENGRNRIFDPKDAREEYAADRSQRRIAEITVQWRHGARQNIAAKAVEREKSKISRLVVLGQRGAALARWSTDPVSLSRSIRRSETRLSRETFTAPSRYRTRSHR